MPPIVEVKVPDIGDFPEVDVIDVLVKSGETVSVEDPLITLESDKATMDVPSPQAGRVREVTVKTGDKIAQGSLILTLEVDAAIETTPPSTEPGDSQSATDTGAAASSTAAVQADIDTEVLVLGAGPGGYTAAFRAADLGKKTLLLERHEKLGGVCLNVGCIPSKALLHAANVISDTREMAKHGVNFGKPKIDLDKLRQWKDSIVGKLTKGLSGLAKQRKVQLVRGVGKFVGPNQIQVESENGIRTIQFQSAIIAAGSESVRLPDLPEDDRIMTSTGALTLQDIPKRLLVIGGGIIGLEMAAVYSELGSQVSVVELSATLMPGVDPDIVRPLARRVQKQYENIFLNTRVSKVSAKKGGIEVQFEGDKVPKKETYDRVLIAVGRRPNGTLIGAENAGVNIDEHGFIPVDEHQRTNVPHIYAIGDITGQPMLAHKATHEGKVAAEVIAGLKSGFDARVIPSVAYTDPEVAWVGPTEIELKQSGREYGKGNFPWAASGRALGLGRDEGMTKLLFDKQTGQVIGAGIVGPNAGDLIAEVALAIEMGADAQDIGLTIHPHPTLSETIAFAAEAFEGTITDLYIPKR